jgi:hypothetical protein
VRSLSLLLACLLATSAEARPPEYSQDASQALTTTYAASTLTNDGGASRKWAQRGTLGLAFCQLTSISSATTITWFVSLDSAGEEAITPAQTDTILDHDSDNTGSIARSMSVPVLSAEDSLYIFAKTDAGTATAACRIYWE